MSRLSRLKGVAGLAFKLNKDLAWEASRDAVSTKGDATGAILAFANTSVPAAHGDRCGAVNGEVDMMNVVLLWLVLPYFLRGLCVEKWRELSVLQ